MKKYSVTVKYGDPGKLKTNSQTVNVEAESDTSAMRLAVAKLKNSNAIYVGKEFDAIEVQER